MNWARQSAIPLLLTLLAVAWPAPVAAQGGGAEAAAVKSYPDSKKGLQQLLEDMHAAAQGADEAAFQAYARALVLPEPEAWFTRVFGPQKGALLAQAYLEHRQGLHLTLGEAFRQIPRRNLKKIDTFRFDDPCDFRANERQLAVLFETDEFTPLYAARLIGKEKNSVDLWFFAYQGGGFRYVDNLHPATLREPAPPPAPAPPGGPPKRIRIGGEVQAARLLHRVVPAYPPLARMRGIGGTVKLQALISKAGTIENLEVLSGDCRLARAASAAVRQWRYQPTLLEGEPVEVITTIDVIFTLEQRPRLPQGFP